MLQSGCLGGENLYRARWAQENDLRWLIKVAMAGLAARRLAWCKGLFDASLQQAIDLEMLRVPDKDMPGAGPTKEQYDKVMSREPAVRARPPRSWADADYESEDVGGEPAVLVRAA